MRKGSESRCQVTCGMHVPFLQRRQVELGKLPMLLLGNVDPEHRLRIVVFDLDVLLHQRHHQRDVHVRWLREPELRALQPRDSAWDLAFVLDGSCEQVFVVGKVQDHVGHACGPRSESTSRCEPTASSRKPQAESLKPKPRKHKAERTQGGRESTHRCETTP
eukprot:3626905-Rhodomonas_salina.1